MVSGEARIENRESTIDNRESRIENRGSAFAEASADTVSKNLSGFRGKEMERLERSD